MLDGTGGFTPTVTVNIDPPTVQKKGWWQRVKELLGFGAASAGVTAGGATARGEAVSPIVAITAPGITTVVPNMTIRDRRGNITYQGNVDLQPTYSRIQNGIKDSHYNDGTTFRNNEQALPVQTDGSYYTEHVVRTPGLSEVGPQRIITGRGGEAWYTPDHYDSYIPLNQATKNAGWGPAVRKNNP